MNYNKSISANQSLPWYDDRVEVIREEELPATGGQYDDITRRTKYNTPKRIYGYLNRHVWKQEEAKKAASIIAWNCFERGIRSNAMFIGPTGCGKSHIWRCLKKIFPDRIEIVDGSNLTLDGWRGEKKWKTLLSSPIFRSGSYTVLVIDEADKMLMPKFTASGENMSHSIQSEGLTIMEGIPVDKGRFHRLQDRHEKNQLRVLRSILCESSGCGRKREREPHRFRCGGEGGKGV